MYKSEHTDLELGMYVNSNLMLSAHLAGSLFAVTLDSYYALRSVCICL